MRTLADAGPLVAFLNKRDKHFSWAAAEFARLPAPLLTCEAVLTEACFLIARQGGSAAAPLSLLERGAISLGFNLSEERDAVARIMNRYASLGASLADACLVRMSELHPRSQIFTIDRDFLVYRRDGRRTIPLIAPFES